MLIGMGIGMLMLIMLILMLNLYWWVVFLLCVKIVVLLL